MQAEAAGVARFIKERIETGEVEPGRVLVLAPRRQFGYAVRDELAREANAIPAQSFFNEEAEEAKAAFSLLTLAADREDRVALRCWCGYGSPSLRTGGWGRIRTYCEQDGSSPWPALEELEAGRLNLPNTRALVSQFGALKVALERLGELRGHQLADAIFPEQQAWAEPFRRMSAAIDEEDFDPKYLRDYRVEKIRQPELPTDVDYVRIMSLHKSKGLTADLVVVVGCIQGLTPFLPDDAPDAERSPLLEKQRRLFYVALTRTRSVLVLSSVTQLPPQLAYRMRVPARRGHGAPTIASQFLNEPGPAKPAAIRGALLFRP